DTTACPNSVVVNSSTVLVGDNAVLVETLACGADEVKRGLFPPPHKTTSTKSDSCATNGDLPPISEDCQTIYNSITILQGSIAPTFDVPSNGIQQLTFGTCRVFFSNFSPKTITYCWTSLSTQASAAGTLCFPPTQPVQSLGLCNSADKTWQVG
ncbi:hypothetical protein BDW22DRAFT_1338579, partial [Trametopsis cervina]